MFSSNIFPNVEHAPPAWGTYGLAFSISVTLVAYAAITIKIWLKKKQAVVPVLQQHFQQQQQLQIQVIAAPMEHVNGENQIQNHPSSVVVNSLLDLRSILLLLLCTLFAALLFAASSVGLPASPGAVKLAVFLLLTLVAPASVYARRPHLVLVLRRELLHGAGS